MPLLSLLTISSAPSLVWTTILRAGYCSCFITCVPASAVILRIAAGGSCWKFTWPRSHFLKTLPWFPSSKEKEYTSLGWPTRPLPPQASRPLLCPLPRLLPLPASLSPGICMITTPLLCSSEAAQMTLLKIATHSASTIPHSWSSVHRSSFHLVTNSITYLFVMLMAVVYFYKGRSLFVHWCLPSKPLEQCLAQAGTLEMDEWWRVHRVTVVHGDRWNASEGGTDNSVFKLGPHAPAVGGHRKA